MKHLILALILASLSGCATRPVLNADGSEMSFGQKIALSTSMLASGFQSGFNASRASAPTTCHSYGDHGYVHTSCY